MSSPYLQDKELNLIKDQARLIDSLEKEIAQLRELNLILKNESFHSPPKQKKKITPKRNKGMGKIIQLSEARRMKSTGST